MSGGEIPAHGDCRLPVQLLFGVVLCTAAQHLCYEEHEKHRHQQQCQPAIANPLHTDLPYRTRGCMFDPRYVASAATATTPARANGAASSAAVVGLVRADSEM